MIAFMVTANAIWLMTMVSWIATYALGPGKLPFAIPPYELETFVQSGKQAEAENAPSSSNTQCTVPSPSMARNSNFTLPPAIFECDVNGLPFWCAQCSTLKLLRSHHSSISNRCIPLFDHYCSFLGSTIGKRNFGPFCSFVISIELLMCFTCITIIVYAAIWNRLHASLITFLIITGLLAALVGNLFSNLVGDVYQGETTVERLGRNRWKRELSKNRDSLTYASYVNVEHPHSKSIRLVIELSPTDLLYDNGFLDNLGLWFFNMDVLTTPQELSDFQSGMFGKQFREAVKQRVLTGNYKIFGSGKDLSPVGI